MIIHNNHPSTEDSPIILSISQLMQLLEEIPPLLVSILTSPNHSGETQWSEATLETALLIMCNKTLLNAPMSSRTYDTWERNIAHEQLIDCSSCSHSKRRRCHHKMSSTNRGTSSTPKHKKKLQHPKDLSPIEGHLLNAKRQVGFTSKPQARQPKVVGNTKSNASYTVAQLTATRN